MVHQRLLGEEPERSFTPSGLQSTEAVAEWDLSAGAADVRDLFELEGATFDQRGLVVSAETSKIFFRFHEPMALDRFEIVGRGLLGSTFFMLWVDEDGGEHVVRGIARETFKTNLVKDGAVSSKVSRMELWLSNVDQQAGPPVLEHFVFSQLVSKPSRYRHVAKKTWKLGHRGHFNDAWWLMAKAPRRAEMVVPANAVLRFDYAELLPNPVPVDLKVTVDAGAGAAEVVFRETVDERAATGWLRREVALDRWAGQSIALEFAIEHEAGALAGLALALPEVLEPAELTQPNVFLFSLDTLRADRMSVYGAQRSTSPRLEDWSRRSAVVFEDVTANAPWTLPSHTSMLSGLDPLEHGVNSNDPIPKSIVFLAQRFQAAGYRTIAVVAGAFLSPQYGFDRGFDRYVSRDPLVSEELELGMTQMRELVEIESDRPLFVFFHTYETHSPYIAREPYFSQFGGDPSRLPESYLVSVGDPSPTGGMTEFAVVESSTASANTVEIPSDTSGVLDELPALYDSAIAYTDELLGDFLDELERAPWGKSSAVLITSDHGEGLGEMGRYAHGRLTEDNLAVPLLLRLPGREFAGKREAQPVQVIDVTPTLLGAAGLGWERPSETSGRDLQALLRGDSFPPRLSWSYAARARRGLAVKSADGTKYYFRNGAAIRQEEREQLYDLATDPLETADLWGERSEPRLARAVAERLLGRRGLVEVRLKNAGVEPLRVRMSGHQLHDGHFTALEIAPTCFERTSGAVVWLAALPGQSCDLRLELIDPRSDPISVALGFGGEPNDFREVERFDVDLEPDQGSHTWTAERGAWRQGTAGEASLEISWDRVAGATSLELTPEEDAQLKEQLEALGYLN